MFLGRSFSSVVLNRLTRFSRVSSACIAYLLLSLKVSWEDCTIWIFRWTTLPLRFGPPVVFLLFLLFFFSCWSTPLALFHAPAATRCTFNSLHVCILRFSGWCVVIDRLSTHVCSLCCFDLLSQGFPVSLSSAIPVAPIIGLWRFRTIMYAAYWPYLWCGAVVRVISQLQFSRH